MENQTYTIKEVAEKTNLTIPTIRYYETEGVLPPVERSESGNRVFTDSDIGWLDLICCLRGTGMPIRKIKQFVQWCLEGDDTIDDRIEMLIEHGKTVDEQLQVLTNYKAAIEWKINYHREMKMQIDARRNAVRLMEQQDLKN